ncbi:type 2 lanthipeptide synthetase LanM [Nocardiopsis sp. NPDC050513]|uniref:type 2 lanthipeptide synthetase LanM n=1 Tax=Nocardiopsis sp. NPDC050513 TaxID=3364338 RepID=UPI0037A9E0A9
MGIQPEDDVLPDLVRERVEEKSGLFGGFYRPFLLDCAGRMRAWQTESPRSVDLPSLAASVLGSVMDLCQSIGARTLITAFRSQDHSPERPRLGYADFHARVSSDEGRAELFDAFPELERLLDLASRRRMDLVQEVLDGVRRDTSQLADAFGAQGRVVAIAPGAGDSHRGGRAVCFVTFDNGVSVVYKPQRWSCHGLVDALRSVVDEDGGFFGPLFPRALVRPEYVWQGVVRPTHLDGPVEAGEYFRRFGRSAALLTLIGANDLHHENVIATAQGPVVVDTETLISLPNRSDPGSGHAVGGDIEASVLNTLLFHARYPGMVLDMDISAIGNVKQSESRQLDSFVVVDEGTDDIRFDKVAVGMEPGPNMAATHDGWIDPTMWVDEVVAGFEEAHGRLRERLGGIEAVLNETDDWSVRQIVRPTFVYARFLQASTHPAYLRDRGDRRTLLEKLPRHHRGVTEGERDAVFEEEILSLLDMDVPLFEVGCDARDMVSGDTAIADTVVATPRRSALARVRAFFERPVERDLAYIRYALACSHDDIWEKRHGPFEEDAPHGRTLLPELADPGPWHTRLGALVLGGPERPTWIMPVLDGTALRFGAVNSLLYEGGGLLLYLARAASAQGGNATGIDVGNAYATAAGKPLPVPPAPTPMSLSPFTGNLSQRVTGLELERLGIGVREALPETVFQDDRDAGPDGLSTEDFDYLNGLSGYLAYHCEYGVADDPVLPGLEPDRLLDRLVDLDGSPTEHGGAVGLAHGRFGRIVAMSAMVRRGEDRLGRAAAHLERFASAYLRHRWLDDALRDRAKSGTWCKGYAGVAFGLTKLLRAVGHSAAETRAAIAPEVERVVGDDLGRDISFCHGVSGRVAMLCWLADRLDWPELRTEAKGLGTRFLERHGDGSWTCGVGIALDLPSFLFGLSGWHFTRLMVDDPTVELPLCLGGR